MLAWKPGDPIERKADVVLYYKGHSYAALVNISTAKVESFEELKGMQAPYTTTEEQEVNDAIKHDPRIVDALKKRGITDLNLVTCLCDARRIHRSAGAGRTPDRMGRLRVQHRLGERDGRPRSGRHLLHRRYGDEESDAVYATMGLCPWRRSASSTTRMAVLRWPGPSRS